MPGGSEEQTNRRNATIPRRMSPPPAVHLRSMCSAVALTCCRHRCCTGGWVAAAGLHWVGVCHPVHAAADRPSHSTQTYT